MDGLIRQHRIAPLGIKTRALEVGPEADEAIVFLHGHPGSAEDWEGLLLAVAPLARGVAFDLPSMGQAERLTVWDYSAGTYSSFFAAAFLELGIKRTHLVMHDLGGTALLWAATHPEQFLSAVLIDTGILIDYSWHLVARLYRAWPLGELMTALTTRLGFRGAMRLYNPQPRKLPAEIIERWWSEYDRRAARAALAFYRATPPAIMERLAAPLRALDRPALVLWGAHDPALPPEQAHNQRKSFPSAEIVVFDDSGHWPYLDDPERSLAVIVPFLARQLKRYPERASAQSTAPSTP